MMKKVICVLTPIIWFLFFLWFIDIEIERNVENGLVIFFLMPAVGFMGFVLGDLFGLYEIKGLK